MDQDTLRRRLMTTFLGELEEHARALNRDLLAIENGPADGRAELLISLFRSVHSLKGASRSVNVQPIETACHRLECLLGAVRDGRRPLSPEIVQLLYTSIDALKDSGERLRAHEDGSGAPLEALLPALDDALRRTDGVRAPASRPETSPSPAPEPIARPRQEFVRVAVDKIDGLLVGGGELLVARRRAVATQQEVVQLHDDIRQWRSEWRWLEQPLRTLLTSQTRLLPTRAAVAFERTSGHLKALERRVEQLAVRMAAENHGLERAAASLEDDIRGVRMFPFSHACEGFERTVRDLTHESAKQIDLVIEGGDVQVGRLVLEHLKDPLLHLVRNAVDHGIETKEERLALGKPGRGNVTVMAGLHGGGLEIVVADDGRGLDMAAIREHAQRRHVEVPKDDRGASRLIFLPGFSTARLITAVSGRGIGLDVVKHRVESLHGHVDVAFEPGRGTRVVINVPLTIATIRALLFGAAGHVFALPVTSVHRLARVGAGDIASAGGREVLLLHGSPVPIVSLIDLLGIRGGIPPHTGGRIPLVIVALGTTRVALVVDELIAEEEILVKSLGPRLLRIRHFAGATILPSGRVVLILNAADVVHSALALAPGRAFTAARTETAVGRKRLL